MCGIVVTLGSADVNICSEALKNIRHRGQDDDQVYKGENINIGFNRLAINDASSNGHQPFVYNNLVGVFNGEIFNSKELAQKYDIPLKSTSDVEVILPLYERIGERIIDELDGFYAGVIYDAKTGKVFTLRDYIGKKPLFYGTTANTRFISSELKAFKELESFQAIPKGFCKISENSIEIIKEHNFNSEIDHSIKDLIIQSTLKRIPKQNAKFGVFLSGGLDSSIIASIVSQQSKNVIYYTLGDENNQDVSFVEELAKYLSIQEQIKYVSLPTGEELGHLIEKVVYHTESYNPSIISNGLATYILAKSAKEDDLKVVLSGEGADELFCGYKLSGGVLETFKKCEILIENLHYTEVRRLDLASMANTIEVRCPFLDKSVYASSRKISVSLLEDKKILRDLFKNDLPHEIVERKKVSLDVGSGIRKLVVQHLTRGGDSETEALKKVWCKYFQKELSDKEYFYQYPVFDQLIQNRGVTHK